MLISGIESEYHGIPAKFLNVKKGAQFGDLRFLLTSVLDATTEEATNLKARLKNEFSHPVSHYDSIIQQWFCESFFVISNQQLHSIAKKSKFKLERDLRLARCQGAVGGLPGKSPEEIFFVSKIFFFIRISGAKCELSGIDLKNSPRVIFFGENAEYSFSAISADPETNITANILGIFQISRKSDLRNIVYFLGQSHRQAFQNRGDHYDLEIGDMEESSTVQNIHDFISYKFESRQN